MASYMTQMVLKRVHLGIYCGFQTEHRPAENSLKGDVRHSRIRRQGGRKVSLAPSRHREAGVFLSSNV